MSTTDGQPQGGQAYPPGPTYGIPQQGEPPTTPYEKVPPPPAPGTYPPPAQGTYPPPAPGTYPPPAQGTYPPPAPGTYPPPAPGGYPPPPAGGFPTPAPAPPARGKKASGIISVVVLLLVVGGIFAINWFTGRDDIANASVGDCATYEEGANDPYKKADCTDAAATFVVLKIAEGDEECKDVPGAERSISKDGGDEICFGLKGVDPATSINVAQEGDCLAVVGNDAIRTPCSSTEATHTVLRRLTDVSTAATDPCEDLEEYTDSYSWSWVSDSGPDLSGLRSDVLLCLSEL